MKEKVRKGSKWRSKQLIKLEGEIKWSEKSSYENIAKWEEWRGKDKTE
jgi:hypothetical protein